MGLGQLHSLGRSLGVEIKRMMSFGKGCNEKVRPQCKDMFSSLK